ncbi:hypothetical protein BGX28_002947 [Mortierella sp. GBA30]|nr:hypothetical protein BGX28_002947 [Mortierella sp. GBA30]
MQSIGHDLRRGLNNFTLGNYKNINKWLAELKNIDSSLKTLDKEITTNAKLISAWGRNEGEDLSDICQRMTQLMEEVGLIHQAYSIQHTAYRKMIKGLKTQEMTLDDVGVNESPRLTKMHIWYLEGRTVFNTVSSLSLLVRVLTVFLPPQNRKRKHDLANQIAKQQKSSKENPIKMMELQNLFDRVSTELLTQELGLLQFKRATIRDAFNSQFDAMIEFAEKMALIAGYGRQITNVIDVGPQEAEKSTLYSGAEYTAAAINQVRVAVTSWQAQPVGEPIRAPMQDELTLSATATAYDDHTPPMGGQQHYRGDSYSPTNSHSNGHSVVNGEDDVQMLKLNASHSSLNDHHGTDYENWKQEIHGAADRADDYLSPPSSNPEASPYVQSQQISQLHEQQRQLQLEQQRAYQKNLTSHSPSPSQQHYQNAAASVATTLRQSSADSYGNGTASGSPSNISGRPFTPTTLRRSDTTDMYASSNLGSPSPAYSSYQHQPASYENKMSTVPARGYRLGFVDPRERSRMERMDNSELYKSDIGTTAGPRYPRSTAIMDEK